MLPSGTLTFLITDLEGSTRLWDEYPEAMREAIAWHDQVLADAMARRGGLVVKTTGDGLLAVFTGADAAVAAAVDAQRTFADREFAGVGSLSVRIGINVGEAYQRAGDYFGSAVNRTARITGAGRGGQILVSDATALLARTAGWETIELGVVELRGLAEPERVHQVAAPGLRRDFPPLETARGFPNNLPATISDFVGRARDVAGGRELLQAARLVTITGPGGIGKTRLALEIAARAGRRYADGVWFADLSPATNAEVVVETVATALGVVEEPGRSLAEGVGAYLAARHVLLVLDSCERVLEEVRRVAEAWLQAAPDLTILTTSRQRLGAAGESVWPVGPLGEEALGDAAVQLFIARAEAVNPHLDVAAHGDAIERLCRALDGIPLAIELAAARVSALAPGQILARLDSHFRILRRRDDAHRHGSLRAAIEWSYELLDPAEARLFAAMAVFSGGFDLEAVEALAAAAGADEQDAVELVTSLVDKSLIVSQAGPAEPRYRYLETLRQFALARLDEAGGTEAAMEAQARWALRHVGADVALLETEQEAWASRLRERHNLDQALEWMVERGDAAGAAQLAAGLNSVWQWLAYREGLGWYRRIIALPGLEPGDRMNVLCSAAWLEWSFGDPQAAGMMVGEARQIAAAHGLALPLQGLAVLAVIAAFDDQPEQAIELASQALERATSREGAAEVAAATFALVWAYVSVGRFDEADAVAARALPFARSTGNESMLTIALMGLAVAKRAVDPQQALELLDEAASLAEESGARWHLAAATLHRGYCWLLLGDGARSVGQFARAARLAYDVGDHRACCSAMEAIASGAARAGRRDEAVRLLAGAARMRAELAGVAGLRVETAHRARTIARLRADVGPAFDDLWAEGEGRPFPALVEAAERLGRVLAGGDAAAGH